MWRTRKVLGITASSPLSLVNDIYPYFGVDPAKRSGSFHEWLCRSRSGMNDVAVCTASSSPVPSSVALLSNSEDVFANLAAEESLLRAVVLRNDEHLLYMYVNSPCVVLGRNQNCFSEVHVRRVCDDGVPIARRSSGGGAVYHDRGNLCMSFFTSRQSYAPAKSVQILRRFLCTEYGIAPSRLTTTNRCDLFLDGRKITGSAMRVQRDVAYMHCTLLISSDLSTLGDLLKPPADQYAAFHSKSVGSIRSPVTSLVSSACLPRTPGVEWKVAMRFGAFFGSHASAIMHEDAPWELPDSASLKPSGSSLPCAEPLLLEVAAILASPAVAMVDGEGRRRSRDASCTLQEEVDKLRSVEWLYNMPEFCTTVALMRGECRVVCDGPQSCYLPVAERLLDLLFSTASPPHFSGVLYLSTKVLQRKVEEVSLAWFPPLGDRCRSGGGEEDGTLTPMASPPWLSPLLEVALVGSMVDERDRSHEQGEAMARGLAIEAPDVYEWLRAALEAGDRTGCDASDRGVAVVLNTIIESVWRVGAEKNAWHSLTPQPKR